MKKNTAEFKEFLEAKGFKVSDVQEDVTYGYQSDYYKWDYRKSNDDRVTCEMEVKTKNFANEDWNSTNSIFEFKIKANGLIGIFTDAESEYGDVCLGTFDVEDAKAFVEILNRRK